MSYYSTSRWLRCTEQVYNSYLLNDRFDEQKKAFESRPNIVLRRPWYSGSVLAQCETLDDDFLMPSLSRDGTVCFEAPTSARIPSIRIDSPISEGTVVDLSTVTNDSPDLCRLRPLFQRPDP